MQTLVETACMYRVHHLKRYPTATYQPLHAQNDETICFVEFLQPHSFAAAHVLLEIAVLSLSVHLSQTDISCIPKFCYYPVYCCLIRYFLVRIRIAVRFTNNSRLFR
jgi:hypothetical protein